MRAYFIMSSFFALFALNVSSASSTNKPSTYAGLSDTQYSRCIDLGVQVMNDMNKYGLDSTQHKESYSEWNSECSLTALWDVAKKQNTNFPNSPLDWANLK